MVRLSYHQIRLFNSVFMLSFLFTLVRSIPIERMTRTNENSLIRRGDTFIPPPTYLTHGNYPPVKYRSSTHVQTQRTPIDINNHPDKKGQRSHATPSAKTHWSGMADMRKSSLKRTGSQKDLWWQGNHGDGGTPKRKKNETKYNFHSKK